MIKLDEIELNSSGNFSLWHYYSLQRMASIIVIRLNHPIWSVLEGLSRNVRDLWFFIRSKTLQNNLLSKFRSLSVKNPNGFPNLAKNRNTLRVHPHHYGLVILSWEPTTISTSGKAACIWQWFYFAWWCCCIALRIHDIRALGRWLHLSNQQHLTTSVNKSDNWHHICCSTLGLIGIVSDLSGTEFGLGRPDRSL